MSEVRALRRSEQVMTITTDIVHELGDRMVDRLGDLWEVVAVTPLDGVMQTLELRHPLSSPDPNPWPRAGRFWLFRGWKR